MNGGAFKNGCEQQNSPNREQRRERMSRCSAAMSAGVDVVVAVAVQWLQVTLRSLGEASKAFNSHSPCVYAAQKRSTAKFGRV